MRIPLDSAAKLMAPKFKKLCCQSAWEWQEVGRKTVRIIELGISINSNICIYKVGKNGQSWTNKWSWGIVSYQYSFVKTAPHCTLSKEWNVCPINVIPSEFFTSRLRCQLPGALALNYSTHSLGRNMNFEYNYCKNVLATRRGKFCSVGHWVLGLY